MNASSYTRESDFAEKIANNRYTVEGTGIGKYKITYTASVEDIVNEGGGNQNNINAGNAWDVLPTTGNPNIDKVRDKLNDLSQHDSGGYVKALTNLAPTEAQTALRSTREVGNLIGRQIAARQQGQGKNSGDVFKKTGIWLEGLANYSKQDGASSSAGFTGKTAGFALGFDGEIDNEFSVGFGYAFNDTKADSINRDTDIDGHTIFAYGKYQPADWYLRGMVNYGFADYKEKANVGGIINTAKYDVQNAGASVYYGYDLKNGFVPEVGLRYTYMTQESYTDTIGQRISADDANVLTAVIGASYAKTFADGEVSWTPKARLAMTYDVLSDDSKATVNIGTLGYEINGDKLERLGFEAGVGLSADVDEWELSASYDLGLRKDYISHTGMLKAKYNF